MLFRQQNQKRLFAQEMRLQDRALLAGRHNSDVERSVLQPQSQVFGCVLQDFEDDLRVARLKFPDQLRQNIGLMAENATDYERVAGYDAELRGLRAEKGATEEAWLELSSELEAG